MENTNKLIFKILSDEPTDKDAFGSHEKVAQAISDLISNEDKGKSIALIGNWGSGKSSVVEILKANVNKNNIAKLFVFDVWAHKGDYIRRAFLEKLIDYFYPLDGFLREKWDSVKDLLAKRYEETRIESYAIPTKWSIRLAVAVFFIPLGIAIISLSQHFPGILIVLGFAFVALPLAVLFFIYMDYLDAGEEGKKKIMSIFIEKGEEKRHTKTFRTPQPTSIEFHQYFVDLLKDGLAQFDEKLIIVIDNIDRVDPEEAKNIWAEMRTFFETENCTVEERLWLLVPISEPGISKIWEKDPNLIDSFENKTFQARFDVSPPVLKDWKNYFYSKMNDAFPNFNDPDEFHRVYRIYRSEVYSKAGYPTPRDIIIFINRIGAIYLQRRDEIELNMIALYVALNTYKEFSANALISKSNELLRPATKLLVGDDFSKYLAAIHYNVPVEKALCVLLGPKIEGAISKRDSMEFSKLRERYGFEDVLEEVIDDNIEIWAQHPSILTFIVNCIKTIDPQKNHGTQSIWNRLSFYVQNIKSWPYLNEAQSQDISALITHEKKEAFCTAILKALSDSRPSGLSVEKITNDENIEDWIDGTVVILRSIIDLGMSPIITENFKCPGDGPIYVRSMKLLLSNDSNRELAIYFRPTVDQEAINSVFVSAISAGSFSDLDHKVLMNLKIIDSEWQWDEIALSICNRIKAIGEVQLPELEFLLQALLDLAECSDQAKLLLKQISAEGYLFDYIPKAHADNNSIVIAYLTTAILTHNPGLLATVNEGQIQHGLQFFRAFLKNPDSMDYSLMDLKRIVLIYNKINWIFTILKDQEDKKALMITILRGICIQENVTDHISVQNLIKNEHLIYTALEDDYEKSIKTYVESTNLIEELKSRDFNYSLASLYRAAFIADKGKSKSYLNFIIDNLKEIDKNTWNEEIKHKYHNLFDLAAEISSSGNDLNLSTPFKDALKDYMKQLLKGKQIDKISNQWGNLIGALNDDIRITFITDVADDIIEGDESQEVIIDLFGDILLDCEALHERRNVIVRKAFDRFYSKDRLKKLAWFSNVLESCPRIYKESEKAFKTALKESVKTELKNFDRKSEKGQILSEIAKTLKIKIPEAESDENANSTESQ